METYAVVVPTRPYSHSTRLTWTTVERGLGYEVAVGLAQEIAARQPFLPSPIVEPSTRYRFSGFSAVNRQPQQ